VLYACTERLVPRLASSMMVRAENRDMADYLSTSGKVSAILRLFDATGKPETTRVPAQIQLLGCPRSDLTPPPRIGVVHSAMLMFFPILPMRNIRIHVDLPLVLDATVALPAQAAEHLVRVLRMEAGNPVTLFNGDGFDYPSVLLAVGKRDVTAKVQSRLQLANESPLRLTLAQGIARGEKMDLIVQKATELGVERIVPLQTERAEVKLDAARAEKRLMHWRAVAASASEQSGRACLPQIMPAIRLAEWLESLAEDGSLRLAMFPDATCSVRELLFAKPCGVLVVGPEGGLGERDISALKAKGFSALRLGPRILRTETAGLAALAALQAVHGDG
jgi:16S rRNA (uracil1498-N3)-methyltransferase